MDNNAAPERKQRLRRSSVISSVSLEVRALRAVRCILSALIEQIHLSRTKAPGPGQSTCKKGCRCPALSSADLPLDPSISLRPVRNREANSSTSRFGILCEHLLPFPAIVCRPGFRERRRRVHPGAGVQCRCCFPCCLGAFLSKALSFAQSGLHVFSDHEVITPVDVRIWQWAIQIDAH